MHLLQLDMIQTAGIGALAMMVGIWLTRHVSFLHRFCVPAPVSGGILFSLITLALYLFTNIEVTFDGTLKDFFMVAFFTTVGFQSDIKVLKQGGRKLAIMIFLLVLIIIMQNSIALGITKILDVNSLIGMAAGSISMTGGHGTAGGFTSILEGMGLDDAATLSMAAATFGLVAGSMIGGPLAERIVRNKLSLKQIKAEIAVAMLSATNNKESATGKETEVHLYAKATYTILLVMAGGTLLTWVLQQTGITFPTYFGALILAVVVRNVMGISKKLEKQLETDRIVSIGNICLFLFLGMAMISLKLWELQTLALPLLLILFCQIALIAMFAYFIAFRMLGKDYDAAILVSGFCGFGLGATPNAMANMSAVCNKYHYTVKPFLIVPIVGGMFSDLINTGIITLFLFFIGA